MCLISKARNHLLVSVVDALREYKIILFQAIIIAFPSKKGWVLLGFIPTSKEMNYTLPSNHLKQKEITGLEILGNLTSGIKATHRKSCHATPCYGVAVLRQRTPGHPNQVHITLGSAVKHLILNSTHSLSSSCTLHRYGLCGIIVRGMIGTMYSVSLNGATTFWDKAPQYLPHFDTCSSAYCSLIMHGSFPALLPCISQQLICHVLVDCWGEACVLASLLFLFEEATATSPNLLAGWPSSYKAEQRNIAKVEGSSSRSTAGFLSTTVANSLPIITRSIICALGFISLDGSEPSWDKCVLTRL